MHWFHDGSPEFVTRRQKSARDDAPDGSHLTGHILKSSVQFVQDKLDNHNAIADFVQHENSFVIDNVGMSLSAPPAPSLTIAEVARETGLGKDTLRVWERRYGFPVPQRDAQGERLYSADDVERLRLIRRLMLQGGRPGQLVSLSLDALRQRLATAPPTPQPMAGHTLELTPAMALLEQHDSAGLRAHLHQAQARLGLAAWVQHLLAPLTQAVGHEWAQGRLSVHQEHLYSEVVQDVLRQAIRALPAPAPTARPRVLLTTLPGESHGLGLLMAEALLALEGAACVSLGVQTPVDALVQAAHIHRADIVALSATACQPERNFGQALLTLRSQLPEPVALWLGGSATHTRRTWPAGCLPVSALADIAPRVAAWRRTQAP